MKITLSIGSNLQDPVEEVEKAIVEIGNRFHIVSQSSRYRTAPVGGPDQPYFVNAVVIIDSQDSPKSVLEQLHAIESKAGRVRDVRWGPRTLDIDIINADGLISEDPDCFLPHPRAHQRAFVLVPWLEADPEAFLMGVGRVRDMAIPNQEVVRI